MSCAGTAGTGGGVGTVEAWRACPSRAVSADERTGSVPWLAVTVQGGLGRQARPWGRCAGCTRGVSAAGRCGLLEPGWGQPGAGGSGEWPRAPLAVQPLCPLCRWPPPGAGDARRARINSAHRCRRWRKRRWCSCRSLPSWPRRCCRSWRSGAGAETCVSCAAPVSTPGTPSAGGRSRRAEGTRRCPQGVTPAPRARRPRRRRESFVRPRGRPRAPGWNRSRIRSCSGSSWRGKGCSCRRRRRSRARVMSCPRWGPGEGSEQAGVPVGRGRPWVQARGLWPRELPEVSALS